MRNAFRLGGVLLFALALVLTSTVGVSANAFARSLVYSDVTGRQSALPLGLALHRESTSISNAPPSRSKSPQIHWSERIVSGAADARVGRPTVFASTLEAIVKLPSVPPTSLYELTSARTTALRFVATNTPATSDVLLNSSKQLQSKFKHAGDFGVAGNYSKANASNFSAALNQHINSGSVTKIAGTYRENPVTHYFGSVDWVERDNGPIRSVR